MKTSLKHLHRSFNNCLTLVALMLAVYILAAPFMPQVSLAVEQQVRPTSIHHVINDVKISSENMLIIPKISIEEKINEGATENALQRGAWRIPFSSTPDKGSNTVIAGHRFYYTKSAVFYHLDKLSIGDSLILDWEGKRYTYTVTTTKIVKPTEVSIQNATTTPTLTLYTCTPLWSSDYRLVIQAEQQVGQNE